MRWSKLFFISMVVISLGACKSTVNQETAGDGLLEEPWKYADNIVEKIIVPEFPDTTFLITDFGAINDGVTDCSKAINSAIEKCTEAGGGKVIVPEGTYLTGPVFLKSNVNLHISEGATLLFTTDKSAYLPVVHTRFEGMECMNYAPLIYAYKQDNIAITGKGTVDGQGVTWWHWKGKWSGSVKYELDSTEMQQNDVKLLTQMVADNVPLEERIFGEGHFLRSSFIQPYLCNNVLIEGIKIIEAPMWIVHPVLCENVTIKDLHIESLGPNNDGCDPECCTNVLIDNCYFNTGDDCIAIKSGRNNDGTRIGIPSENFVIRNCKMVEGHGGVVMGSEISGDVRYIFAEDCEMDSPHLDRAIRIKSNSVRGGTIEHIYARNIEVNQVREAILKINMFYAKERADNIPVARNIYLENVNSKKSKHGIWIKAYEQEPASNIVLKNCTFTNVEEENFIENSDNMVFDNVSVNGKTL